MSEVQGFHRTSLALGKFTGYCGIREERFEGLFLNEMSREQTTPMKELEHAFVQSFNEGLGLFFSPFIGLWKALSDLHVISTSRDLRQF